MLINKTQGTENVYNTVDYTNEGKASAKEEVKTEAPSATLELGTKKEEEVTYKKPTAGKVDRSTINRMIDESNRRMENFKNLIRTLIEKQGGTVEAALSGNFKLKIDEATRLEAQEAISEDGEFGVAKTAGRIVDFAKAISGGDVSKLDTLKKAIKQGFDEAEKILGELPDISKETYKEVMRQLDEWAAGGSELE
ncbi:MAG: hypothetical protein GX366_06785 [Epulopiscium sp.]|nr:hypothetical protein [Candidatus Epulonipiscium sp.]